MAHRNQIHAGERRLGSRLDRLGGAEHPTRTVLCSHPDVSLGGLYRDRGLKALSRGGRHRLKPVGVGTSEHLPGGDLRCTGSTGVERHVTVGSALDRYGGGVVRLPAPREAKGPVGLALGREGGAEEQLAILAELGEERIAATADEDVELGNTCTLPWVAGRTLSGWVYSRTSSAVMVFSSSSKTMPRDCSTSFMLPLSKMVMVPSDWRLASCW